MMTRSIRIAGLLGLFAVIGAAASAADTKSSSSTPPASDSASAVPTYLTVSDLFGEIAKVDSNSITIRVKWTNPPPRLGKNPTPQQRQAAQKAAGPQHKDYTMKYTVDAAARIKHLPPKIGADGKKEGYSPEEWERLKGNAKLPGFKADLSSLKTGQQVQAHIVRTPNSEKTKDPNDDHLVRWVLILNEDTSKSTAATKDTTTPKKSNN
jgi:hypothetical protein